MSNLYKTGELYKVMERFENVYKGQTRLDREKDKEIWKIGSFYENGETNKLFNAFLNGYMYNKSISNL